MGTLTLHRSVNGEAPSLSNQLAEIINGNQGPNWQPFETNVDLSAVPANDIVEVSDLSQVASLLFEHGCIDHD